jgi:hypothetical protein
LGCEEGKRPYYPRYWILPPLKVLRQRWDETRGKVEWPDDDGLWRIGPQKYPEPKGPKDLIGQLPPDVM